MNPDDPCRCSVSTEACTYFCPIHEKHHVVPSMVSWCIQQAGG